MNSSLCSVFFVWLILGPLEPSVVGQFQQSASILHGQTSPYLTQYLLQRLLATNGKENPNSSRQILDRKAIEAHIYGDNVEKTKFVFPETQERIRHYLDEAKELTDVIDFRQPEEVIDRSDTLRRPRQSFIPQNDELQFGGEDLLDSAATASTSSSSKKSAASEQIQVRLEFPGNEYQRPKRSQLASGCTNCVDEGSNLVNSRFSMPLTKLGTKQYYLGIFFKSNWYKAEQYCRFHGMHLASINSAEEQKDLQDHIQAYGMGHEHFWTSGTDQGEEGKFFWMGTGKPITYTNWNAGEPNNFQYEDGEQEHCLEMWDRDGKGLGWNDTPCSFSTFFICEA